MSFSAQDFPRWQAENWQDAPQNPVIGYFETPEALHAALPSLLRDDDTILVKASRGMHLDHTVALLETL